MVPQSSVMMKGLGMMMTMTEKLEWIELLLLFEPISATIDGQIDFNSVNIKEEPMNRRFSWRIGGINISVSEEVSDFRRRQWIKKWLQLSVAWRSNFNILNVFHGHSLPLSH